MTHKGFRSFKLLAHSVSLRPIRRNKFKAAKRIYNYTKNKHNYTKNKQHIILKIPNLHKLAKYNRSLSYSRYISGAQGLSTTSKYRSKL